MPPIKETPRSYYSLLSNPGETDELFDRLKTGEFNAAYDVSYVKDDGAETHMTVFEHEGDNALRALDMIDGKKIEVLDYFVIARKPSRIARVLNSIRKNQYGR